MTRYSRVCLLALMAIFCATARNAFAQQNTPQKSSPMASEHVADRGVLLGLYLPDDADWDRVDNLNGGDKWVPEISAEPHGRYLTMWISKSGGALKIQAINDLLVPRADGFWRVGRQIVKSAQYPESNYDEQFWAVPLGEKPKPSVEDSGSDGRTVRLITYVGPEYLSDTSHWQGGAGAWEYENAEVLSLHDLTKDMSVEEVLGPAAGAAYKRLAKSMDHMNEKTEDVCNCCTGDETRWGILHVGDSWQTFARFQYGPSSSCSQGSEDRVVPSAVLPKNLAPGGSLGRPWADLRLEAEKVLKVNPGSVRHMFISPKKDLVVTLGTNGLAVLGVENLHIRNVLGVRVFEKPCIPVMEQWSVGLFVSAWENVMQKQPSAEMPQ